MKRRRKKARKEVTAGYKAELIVPFRAFAYIAVAYTV